MARLTERDAAAELGVAPKTLRNWRYDGFGPRYIKVGRSVRYDTAELDRWCKSRTYRQTHKAPVAS